MRANSNGSTAAATATAGHGPSSGVIDATHDTASTSTLHISTCSVEQLEEPEDTFHDAQEHLARSGPSSSNPSPGLNGNAGPNSRVKGVTGDEDAEDAHGSLDATPIQPGEFELPAHASGSQLH